MNKRIFIILTIIWMIIIFAFSGRDGNESSHDSSVVGELVCRIIVKDFEQLGEGEREEMLQSIDFIVRKAAHATEYAILSGLLLGVFFELKKHYMYRAGIAWFIATMYAVTDELHQLFIPGRAGRISDVIIDSLGAFIGLCFLTLVLYIKNRHKIDKNNEYS